MCIQGNFFISKFKILTEINELCKELLYYDLNYDYANNNRYIAWYNEQAYLTKILDDNLIDVSKVKIDYYAVFGNEDFFNYSKLYTIDNIIKFFQSSIMAIKGYNDKKFSYKGRQLNCNELKVKLKI